ncbi:MAG: hypothetical protein RL322_2605 [Pseudomonadota bacterium]|jgi:multidrug efflux pump
MSPHTPREVPHSGALALFILRPVGTTLLTLGIALAGAIAYFLLPVAPLPQVEFPTISVSASLPGASPETMAKSVATPLERSLGAIAGVTEITSSSSQGSTRVVVQFALDRNINSAAREVQAAINAARTLLPSDLPNNPTYRKVNPADAPIMILAMTSEVLSRGQMYDAASTVMAQSLAQVDGIGNVVIGGGALPAVRVQADPNRLAASGISLEDIRVALVSSHSNRPKGAIDDGSRHWQISANDQARQAADFAPLIIRYRNGNAVTLSDVARVSDSVQDVRNHGVANGRPAILLMLYKQPGANIIDAVDRVRALLPKLQASIPAAIDLEVMSDRTPTIRASLKEIQRALAISVGLVIMVVFLFLRNVRAALIPSVAVPVSLAGTFGVMYLAGFSLDNLSLMALTVATGFVVDDAIVVLENISRHVERGKSILQATLDGTREIAFTVVSISLSLIAVFIPILMMGGIVGRLFREFAIVLSVAILVSMIISLTTTPMMCAVLLKREPPRGERGWLARLLAGINRLFQVAYHRSLAWALRAQPVILLALIGVIALNVQLYRTIPKGFFPQQDTGRVVGFIRADQATSFQAMQQRLERFLEIVRADPAVESVTGFTGGGARNAAQMFMALKPLSERKESAAQVVARLRMKLAREPGATLFMVPVQDIRVGGRQASSQYQFTLQSDELETLREWSGPIRRAMADLPQIVDVDSDVQDRGRQTTLVLDREAIARLGLSVRAIDATLNNAFAQRPVGVIYNPLNQYRIVLELLPEFLQSPESLRSLQFVSSSGKLIPITDFARIENSAAPLSVAHQSGTPATTISFNLAPGVALSEASDAVRDAIARIGAPTSIRGTFQGTAGAFAQSLASQPLLILAALVTIYLVLGVLYESLIHPITILSTLPSAGVGALIALKWFNTEFSVIALIAVILLIGIVKKNAIMMIDFAIARQRRSGCSAAAAIYAAARIRLRPILMTTVAAILGAVPLALGTGDGAELRQPLGIAVVGGLLLSQLLTLYSTPVVYVLVDRLRSLALRSWQSLADPSKRADSNGHAGSAGVSLRSIAWVGLIALSALFVSGCTTPPPYTRPALELPERFRETSLFSPAQPGQPIPDRWWRVFDDPVLDQLQTALQTGNHTLRASEAQYRVARAALAASQASLSLPLNASASATRSRTSTGASTTTISPELSTQWELDLWGRVSQTVRAATAQEAASALDLSAVRLSLQATLTQTYFSMRAAEIQSGLLENAVEAYRRLLQLTEDRYRAGVVSAADVAQAQTQLKSSQAQLEDIRASRRVLEHALATLTGRTASQFQVDAQARLPEPPGVPELLPSQLLQRRPDIAAAERRVAAANARLGVAQAAFFPSVTLSTSLGLRAPDLDELFSAPNLVWAIGPRLLQPLLDGGARRAAQDSALASLDQASAQYRQLVLSAMQEVEDSLVQVAALGRQAQLQAESLIAARRAQTLVLDQYRAGTVSFLNVISAQATALNIERSLVDARNRQLAATNQLLKQLAGGWTPEARSPAMTPPRRPGSTEP